MIHLESIQTLPKQIEYLDSLVEKFIVPSPDNPSVASVDEREELSSIFLEVIRHLQLLNKLLNLKLSHKHSCCISPILAVLSVTMWHTFSCSYLLLQ